MSLDDMNDSVCTVANTRMVIDESLIQGIENAKQGLPLTQMSRGDRAIEMMDWEAGKAAAMRGEPLDDVRAAYTRGRSGQSVPDSTRRAFLAVIAAVRRDFPDDFRKLLKESLDITA